MAGVTALPPADRCEAADYHSPVPLRYTWHLIVPAECGGLAEAPNLVQLCDSCRASVRLLTWQIANGGVRVYRPNARQLAYARLGHAGAVAAGRARDIPAP
jgi:hypothetical protein